MKRKTILALGGVMIMAALAAVPASAVRTARVDVGQKVFRSYECKARVNQYDPRSWACTTITVNPWQADAGGTTTVTYLFRAKTTLKYVNVCFSKINLTKTIPCAYRHKYRKLKKGTIVKRVVQLDVPAVSESGGYKFDNYTRFYKRQKWTSTRGLYWAANSYMCVISPSQPDFQCAGGK
jgi:hypothetical protein